MTIKFKNKYGFVELTPITDYMPVLGMSQLPIVNDYLFSMEDAEKLALITDNRMVQVSFPFLCQKDHPKQNQGYIVHHQSASVACVCKVDIVYLGSENNNSPQQEIQSIYDIGVRRL